MTRLNLLLSLAVGLLFLSAKGQFEGDARLNKPITVRAEAETVPNVLKRVGEQVGVSLTASKTVEDDLVVLYAKDLPAQEVLAVIASHFGWSWEKEGDGYRLLQTAAQRKDEEQLLRQAILKPYQKLQELSRNQLAAAAKTAREEVEKQLAVLEDQAIDYSKQQNWEMLGRVNKKDGFLRGLFDPWTRFLNTVLISLTPAQLLEYDFRRLVLSSRPTPSQHRLSVATKEFIEAVIQERKKVEVAREQHRPVRAGAYWPNAFGFGEVVTVRIVLHSPAWASGWSWGDEATITFWGRSGELLAWRPLWIEGTFPEPGPVGIPKPGPPPDRQKNRLDGLEIAEQLRAALPIVRGPLGQVLALPIEERQRALAEGGSKLDPLVGYAKMLTAIAAAADVPLIADLYDIHDKALLKVPVAKPSLGDLLDAYAVGTNSTWKLEGAWAKMRHREWALGRYSTVPRSIVFATRDLAQKQGGLTLDQMAALATKLNDKQAKSSVLQSVASGTWEDSNEGARLYALRFWHEIGPLARNALLTGGHVEYGRLGPAAKSHMREMMLRSAQSFSMQASEDPDDHADAEWRRANWFPPANPLENPRYEQEITQLMPNGLLLDSMVELRSVRRQGLLCSYQGVPFFNSLSRFASSMVHAYDQQAFLNACQYRPALVDKAFFTMRLRPDVVRGVEVHAAVAEPESKFAPFSSLSSSLRKKLAEIAEATRKNEWSPIRPLPPPPERQ